MLRSASKFESCALGAKSDAGLVVATNRRQRPISSSSIERRALTRQEAARSLGVSLDHFERHVQPRIRVIRSGRLVLVPVRELDRWANDAAEMTLGEAD